MTAFKKRSATQAIEQPDQLIAASAREVKKPLWISVSMASQLGGVGQKTIRRAIDDGLLKFKIVNNRYAINLGSLLQFMHTKVKLKNKLRRQGLGQYVRYWR